MTAMTPTSAMAGSAGFTMTVNGSNFVPSSVVVWNNSPRVTTYGSASQLTAVINANDIATAGVAMVSVQNPSPGGGASAGHTFTIQAPNPAPTVTKLSPTSATAGDPAFTLTVTGAGFISTSTVQWNGAARTTTYVSATQLTAAITAADIASAGTATVTVVTPAPGGGTSVGRSFSIVAANPSPAITSLSPSSTTAGHAAFTLVVTGTNFINGSEVRWNGASMPTTYVSATELDAAISVAEVASAGTRTVTVVTPAPGGGTSNGVTFTVNSTAFQAVVDSTSPWKTLTGTPDLLVTVRGSRFVTDSVVKYNGVARTTTYQNFSTLTVLIPAADFENAGTFNVTVENPGAAASSPYEFFVYAPVVPGVFHRIMGTQGLEPNLEVDSPSITPDGRYVVFQAGANNLIPGDTNGWADVYMKDTCASAPAGCAPSIIRVSMANDGSEPDNNAYGLDDIAVTPDGRYVAFSSTATNLVANDTNGIKDVFLRDTCTNAPVGCTPSTILVSVATDGTQGNDNSGHVAVSADGRYVAFENYGTSFGYAGDAVWLRDTCIGAPNGCTPTTTIVSRDTNDGVSSGPGGRPSMSSDARYVAWDDDFSTSNGVFITDTCIGAGVGCTPHAFQIDTDSGGNPMHGYNASISSNGRYLSFTRYVSSMGKVYAADTCIGASGCTPSITLISDPTNGSTASGGTVDHSYVSPDGRYVGFTSFDNNLVAVDTNNSMDMFVYDTCFTVTDPCTPSMHLVSLGYDGNQANKGYHAGSAPLSNGAKTVVFSSTASSLIPWDSNIYVDVFMAHTGL